MITQEQLEVLPFMPKWLGEPMYPAGFPFQPEDFNVQTGLGGRSATLRERINEYYLECLDEKGGILDNPPLSDDDFQVLRQWVIYFLNAPIWSLHGTPDFERLKAKALTVSSWRALNEVAHDCLEFGLAPL